MSFLPETRYECKFCSEEAGLSWHPGEPGVERGLGWADGMADIRCPETTRRHRPKGFHPVAYLVALKYFLVMLRQSGIRRTIKGWR